MLTASVRPVRGDVVLGVAARSADELAESAEVGARDALDDTAGALVLDRRGDGVDEQAVNAMTATAANEHSEQARAGARPTLAHSVVGIRSARAVTLTARASRYRAPANVAQPRTRSNR